MIKGAIFDVDGTLLESMEIWETAASLYLRKLGICPQAELSRILYAMSMEEGAKYLIQTYHLLYDEATIIDGIYQVIADFYQYEVRTKKGVKEFLLSLSSKQIPMVIATSGNRELVEVALKRLGIRSYFQEIFTCSDLQTTKAEPTIYTEAAAFLSLNPKETMVFEDALFALETAYLAGFPTTRVYDKFSIGKTYAPIEIEDFTDFFTYWKKVQILFP